MFDVPVCPVTPLTGMSREFDVTRLHGADISPGLSASPADLRLLPTARRLLRFPYAQ